MSLNAAVIGGGISGLASAKRLVGLGHRVTLLESDDALGGLAGTFAWRGRDLERFYHCILPSDTLLLGHIRELGLEADLLWRRTGMGFVHRGRLFPLNTARDLLRFTPLTLVERVRMGWLGLRARAQGMDPALDRITAADWLRGRTGERAFEALWKPLLAAKIGDAYESLPALWLSSRLHREKNTGPEVKGCLRRGYRSLIDAFERHLRAAGVSIRTGVAVDSIDRRGTGMALALGDGRVEAFDVVVCTAPLIVFQRMTRRLGLVPALAELALDYQGVISGVFFHRRPLTPFYWTPFVDSGTTAQGAIEMSNLVPLERTDGLRVSYLVNYAHRDSRLYQLGDDALLGRYRRDLETLFPQAAGTVVEARLFRTPFVEPIWTVGYAARRPPTSIIPGRLYLACTAQVYPNVNSWNSCCEVVEEMMPRLALETAETTTVRGAALA